MRAGLREMWRKLKAHQAELRAEQDAYDAGSAGARPYNPLVELALVLERLGVRLGWRRHD